jgi:hypothetical protein
MVDAAWSMLEQLLLKYDGCDTNFKYAVLVAEEILKTDQRMHLPRWLVNHFMLGQPACDLVNTHSSSNRTVPPHSGRSFAGSRSNVVPLLRVMVRHFVCVCVCVCVCVLLLLCLFHCQWFIPCCLFFVLFARYD